MGKFWYIGIIATDIALTMLHHLWAHSSAEIEWHVWDVTQAARVCLIPIVMLLQQKLDKWGEMICMNYVAFSILDFIQTIENRNNGLQIEELIGFIMLNIVMIPRWNKL